MQSMGAHNLPSSPTLGEYGLRATMDEHGLGGGRAEFANDWAAGRGVGGRAKFANDWSHNILHVSTMDEYGGGPDFAND